MSRSIKGSKGPGYDYMSRRIGNPSHGCGPFVKLMTHRRERRVAWSLCYKAKVSIHE